MRMTRERILMAKAEKQVRDMRHLVSALQDAMEPPLSDEAAVKLMESCSVLMTWVKRWRYGEPLQAEDPEFPEFPF